MIRSEQLAKQQQGSEVVVVVANNSNTSKPTELNISAIGIPDDEFPLFEECQTIDGGLISSRRERRRMRRRNNCRWVLFASPISKRSSNFWRTPTTGKQTTQRSSRGFAFNANNIFLTATNTLFLILFLLITSFPSALQAGIVVTMDTEKGMRPDRQLAPKLVEEKLDGQQQKGQLMMMTKTTVGGGAMEQNGKSGNNDFVGLLDANDMGGNNAARDTDDGLDAALLQLAAAADKPSTTTMPRFFYTSDSAPSTQAHISRESWERYQRFREETCRKGTEDYLAERALNNTESGYFHWEENEFHRQLRDRLLPQTRGVSFRSLVGSPLLSHLDPRLFTSKPRSLCQAKRHISEADEKQKLAKEEQHLFEDFLINKVFSPAI